MSRRELLAPSTVLGEHHTVLADGRVRCDQCPRQCTLRDGQRGFCFVREARGPDVVLSTYARASGFCVDPIEKKPLAHFHPGTSVLSFGTAGCNLGCRFCQNWDISKARASDRLTDEASPDDIARAARDAGCRSLAFTYNDPVIWGEYAVDCAEAAHARGIATVAVTAGYVDGRAREHFFAPMDAANVDLKAFSEAFYRRQCYAELAPVLETLAWLKAETSVWLEVTTLLIPGLNDGDAELDRMLAWYLEHLGPDTPLHFSAFHPDFKLDDVPPTPPSTVKRARRRALAAGLHHVYTGNIRDPEGQVTTCSGCGEELIGRDTYDVQVYRLTPEGRCPRCDLALAGRFGTKAGNWGTRRMRLPIHPGAPS